MLIVFKARSCANVIMLGGTARQILRLIGKEETANEGIVTVEQMPSAIEVLARAEMADRARTVPETPGTHAGSYDEDGRADENTEPVQLHQRIQPVLLLLKQALAAEAPVTWNVVTSGPVSWGV